MQGTGTPNLRLPSSGDLEEQWRGWDAGGSCTSEEDTFYSALGDGEGGHVWAAMPDLWIVSSRKVRHLDLFFLLVLKISIFFFNIAVTSGSVRMGVPTRRRRRSRGPRGPKQSFPSRLGTVFCRLCFSRMNNRQFLYFHVIFY